MSWRTNLKSHPLPLQQRQQQGQHHAACGNLRAFLSRAFQGSTCCSGKRLTEQKYRLSCSGGEDCRYPGFELYDARSIWKRVQIPATSGHCEQAQATYPPYFNTCIANFLHSNLSKLKDSSSCPWSLSHRIEDSATGETICLPSISQSGTWAQKKKPKKR